MSSAFMAGVHSTAALRLLKNGSAAEGIDDGSFRSKKKYAVRFPPSVVVQSLFQVPSCALLLAWLRSPAAAQAFPRPLLGR